MNAALQAEGSGASPLAISLSGPGDPAAKAAERDARRRKVALRDCAWIAANFAFDGMFLLAFAAAGTVPWKAGATYLGVGWLGCALAAVAIASGWSRRFRDDGLLFFQVLVGMVLCVAGLVAYPQVGFLFGLILIVIFVTATYRASTWQAIAAWLFVSVGAAFATLWLGKGFRIPYGTHAEQLLALLFFAMATGRCVTLSVYNSLINLVMQQRGREQAEILAQIERMANHDELTGVFNRRSLLRMLQEEIARSGRSGAPLCVGLIDLDRFKVINDRLGHLVGDQVLKMFAESVGSHARATDRFGRYGGEEFLIVLIDTPLPEAEVAIERLRQVARDAAWSSIRSHLSVTFSAGLACLREGEAAEQLLARADAALYAAKDAGRNRTCVG